MGWMGAVGGGVEPKERRQGSGSNSSLLSTFLDFGYNWRYLEISGMSA